VKYAASLFFVFYVSKFIVDLFLCVGLTSYGEGETSAKSVDKSL
jgi:hypothetical protein